MIYTDENPNERVRDLEKMLNEQASQNFSKNPYNEEKTIPISRLLIYVFGGGFFLIALQVIYKHI